MNQWMNEWMNDGLATTKNFQRISGKFVLKARDHVSKYYTLSKMCYIVQYFDKNNATLFSPCRLKMIICIWFQNKVKLTMCKLYVDILPELCFFYLHSFSVTKWRMAEAWTYEKYLQSHRLQPSTELIFFMYITIITTTLPHCIYQHLFFVTPNWFIWLTLLNS